MSATQAATLQSNASTAKRPSCLSMTKENISEFYTEDENGCWIWIFSKDSGGYGHIAGYKTQLAHRVVYELFKGPIPNGLLICHSCDNPPCVNPDHLWVGTHHDNLMDAINKGRRHWANKDYVWPDDRWVGTPYTNVRNSVTKERHRHSYYRQINSPLNLVFGNGIAILHSQAMTGVT